MEEHMIRLFQLKIIRNCVVDASNGLLFSTTQTSTYI